MSGFKLYYYESAEKEDKEYLAIANILKNLFTNESTKELLLYIPCKSILDKDSAFSTAIQYLKLDDSIIKKLESVDPVSFQFQDKDVSLQRVVYQNKLDSFGSLEFRDKTLFCPFLSAQDVDKVNERCRMYGVNIVALCENNDYNSKVFQNDFNPEHVFKE